MFALAFASLSAPSQLLVHPSCRLSLYVKVHATRIRMHLPDARFSLLLYCSPLWRLSRRAFRRSSGSLSASRLAARPCMGTAATFFVHAVRWVLRVNTCKQLSLLLWQMVSCFHCGPPRYTHPFPLMIGQPAALKHRYASLSILRYVGFAGQLVAFNDFAG